MSLHKATLGGEWLRQAIRLNNIMLEQFWDESKVILYDTGEGQRDLIIRPQSKFDGAMPCGASTATMVLLKLGRLTNGAHLEQIAVKTLHTVRESLPRYPLGFSNWLCALDFYLSEPKEIVIIGSSSSPATLELLYTLCNTWSPNMVIAAYDPEDADRLVELKLFENRGMINNQPAVYVCRRHSCQIPVTDPVALEKQLRED
jgi:uncharacterized protein YyaL (SSP411 family)